MRFEPAADIYAGSTVIYRNHLARSGPILINARMKAKYPDVVMCDEKTASTVTKRWSSYFPQGMQMGDSVDGHV